MATDVEKQTKTENKSEDERKDEDPSNSAEFVARVLIPLAQAIMGLAFVPILSIAWIIILSLPRKMWKKRVVDYKREVNGGDEIANMYKQSRRQESLWQRTMESSLAALARISIGMLVWLALSLFVPRLKEVALLGSPMWKWSLLGVTLTAGYLESILFLLLLRGALEYIGNTERSYSMGPKFRGELNVGYFGVVLVSWMAYFSTDQGLKEASTPHPQAFHYVKWSLVSLFVGSLLWMFKAFLRAKWRADVIHRRFEHRIFITSLKFFFIGLCAAGFYEQRIVQSLLDGFGNEQDQKGDANPKRFSATIHTMSGKMSLRQFNYVARVLASLVEIMSPLLDRDDEEEEVVSWFQKKINDSTPGDTPSSPAAPPAGREDEVQVPGGPSTEVEDSESALLEPSPLLRSTEDEVQGRPSASCDVPPPPEKKEQRCEPKSLIQLFHSAYPEEVEPAELPSDGREKSFKNRLLQPFMERKKRKERLCLHRNKIIRKNKEKLANVLFGLVREECSSSDLTFHDLKIWMVDAHKDCNNMGRTLADASAMVNRLDLFISCVIIVIVLLLCLLLTGVSSTTVLVTVATPFLALTFVFGDTAKTFFQGLVFCFGTHPFDVGDRCVLDETQLEVKSVNILTTTFMKIGSKEKRLYPNSVLATKTIINLGWQPDPRDVIVLTLDSITSIKILEAKIKKFLTMEKSYYNKDLWKLIVKEVGEGNKVEIHFTHVLTIHDLSHNQCFEKKNKQKSYFLRKVKKFIKESRKEQVNPSKHTQSPINEIKESED